MNVIAIIVLSILLAIAIGGNLMLILTKKLSPNIKFWAILIVSILMLVFAVFLVVAIVAKDKNQELINLYNRAEQMFNDTSSKSANIPNGGLLGQTLGLRDMQPIIENNGDAQLSLMTSCSPNMEKKSCSPWLYMRRDMNPMTFIFPGLGLDAPMVGVLCDASKMFPLIGTMAMIDADSNNGSCCCNAAGYFVLQYNRGYGNVTGLQNGTIPALIKGAIGSQYDSSATYYIAGDRYMMNGTPAWQPGTAPTVCNQCTNTSIPATGKEYLCQVNQAGAGVNTWDMLLIWGDRDYLRKCFTLDPTPKFASKVDLDTYNSAKGTKFGIENIDPTLAKNLKETQSADGSTKTLPSGPMFEVKYTSDPSCVICNSPNLCVFENPPDGSKYPTVIPNYDTPSGEIVASFIGETGELYFKQYMDSLVDPITSDNHTGKWLNLPSVAVRQCKFQRKDWDKWINVQKQFYKNVLSMQDPNSPTFYKGEDGGVHPYQQMYNANPYQGQYFEHEINIYVDPDHQSDYYKKQQDIFADSILGFFYIDQSCEESMDEIKNVKTPVKVCGKNSGCQTSNMNSSDWYKNGSLDNPSQRCDGYFNSAPNPASHIKGDARREAEDQKKQQMRLQVLEMCKRVKQKYNKTVLPLKAYIHSNAFIGNKQTQDSLDGKLQFSDVFKLISPNDTDKQMLECWNKHMQNNIETSNIGNGPYTGQVLTDIVAKNLISLAKCTADGKQAVHSQMSASEARQILSQKRPQLVNPRVSFIKPTDFH